MRVDAHQHFWRLNRGDYGWLTQDLAPIYRDFEPSHLKPLLDDAEMEHCVLVQAAPTLAETRFLLSLAEDNTFVRGVVGWVNFEAPDAPQIVAELASHPKLLGLRPMIQDIADVEWMLRPELSPAFRALVDEGLRFDALVKPEHLVPLNLLLRRYPHLKVIIDHGAKPDIAAGEFDDWAAKIADIAQNDRVYCKLSGLVTEAAEAWTIDDLKPFVDHLITVFGVNRIVWGSDWPVCTLACSYADWLAASETLTHHLGEEAKTAIFGGNAIDFYGLEAAYV